MKRESGVVKNHLLPPGTDNPRNSEGAFITLADGRILFAYTHFDGGKQDHSSAHIAGRFSADGGRTWDSEDHIVLPNEGGMNVMSVSLLRLRSGEIAFLYLKKNSFDSCTGYLRKSFDEAKTWSEPVHVNPREGYYCINNDRMIQLRSGRLVIPAALHLFSGDKFDERGTVTCLLSDDNGATWRETMPRLEHPDPEGVLQEPGVVELKGGRIMMLIRTDSGCQYRSWSSDGGETWADPEPTDLLSPKSPASVKRIPSTGDLLLVWNDHTNIDEELHKKRTPLVVAISRDEGLTWEKKKIIEDDPGGWFCYTAIHFVEDRVLLSYCAGQRANGGGLTDTRLTYFGLDWLYS